MVCVNLFMNMIGKGDDSSYADNYIHCSYRLLPKGALCLGFEYSVVLDTNLIDVYSKCKNLEASWEQVRKMSLPERTFRHVDTSRGPTLATMDQSLKGGESTRTISPTSYFSPKTIRSPSSPVMVERLKQPDLEEDQGLYQKKSVLFKMREGVKRLRNSFRMRKQEEEDRNLTPSWGVTLEEDEEVEEEEDAEYLGAPMYESELAPEGYKENARQHPRANPVISEKHVLHNPVKSRVEQDQEKTHIPAKSTTTTTTQHSTSTTLHDHNMTEKNIAEKLHLAYLSGSNSDAMNFNSSKIQGPTPHHSPNKKMTEKNLAEKLTPAYAAGSNSDATNSIPSKMNGKNLAEKLKPAYAAGSNSHAVNSKPSKMIEKNLAEKLKPTNAAGSNSDATNSMPSKIQGLAISRTSSTNMSSIAPSTPPISSAPISRQTSLSSTSSLNGKNYTNNNPKGASVKEYLKIKLEPMNDEKVLSEVLYEAMSPRRTTIATNDAGVMDKVRGAVHSLLHNEEQYSQQYGVKNSTTLASSQTPAIASNNIQEGHPAPQYYNFSGKRHSWIEEFPPGAQNIVIHDVISMASASV
ncbi:hypothetical protein RIF29_27824 [Crotalaria pallida]|uniref:LTI65/LTI78 PGEED repeat domain-containing protein n=1 Tax=Crotalaria pallida TaxID=3830 RepID=A0AAN9EUM9_CROPI